MSPGIARRERLLAYTGEALARGRGMSSEGGDPPPLTEHALVGGIAALIADRVARGRAAELPGMAPEAIQFALTPYLGIAEARRVRSRRRLSNGAPVARLKYRLSSFSRP